MLDDAQLARLLEGWRKVIKDKTSEGYTLSMNVYTEDESMLTFTIVLSKPELPKEEGLTWVGVEDTSVRTPFRTDPREIGK